VFAYVSIVGLWPSEIILWVAGIVRLSLGVTKGNNIGCWVLRLVFGVKIPTM
jgi:hypothetical protein